MYYEEQIIDGVLCWRNSPRGEWTKRTIEELSTQVAALQARLSLAEKVVEAAEQAKDELNYMTHDQACNGVHAESGQCEGQTRILNLENKLHAALAAYRSAK